MNMSVPSATGKRDVKKRKEGLKNNYRLDTFNITIKEMSQRQRRVTLMGKRA